MLKQITMCEDCKIPIAEGFWLEGKIGAIRKYEQNETVIIGDNTRLHFCTSCWNKKFSDIRVRKFEERVRSYTPNLHPEG